MQVDNSCFHVFRQAVSQQYPVPLIGFAVKVSLPGDGALGNQMCSPSSESPCKDNLCVYLSHICRNNRRGEPVRKKNHTYYTDTKMW